MSARSTIVRDFGGNEVAIPYAHAIETRRSEERMAYFEGGATEGDWVLFNVYSKRGESYKADQIVRQVAKRNGYTEA